MILYLQLPLLLQSLFFLIADMKLNTKKIRQTRHLYVVFA